MNPIQDQQEIIEILYRSMILSLPDVFETAECLFKYNHGYDDGSYSVRSQLTYFIDGSRVTNRILDCNEESVLVPKLHQIMKEHTGGDWKSFKVTITETGSVKTNFNY